MLIFMVHYVREKSYARKNSFEELKKKSNA